MRFAVPAEDLNRAVVEAKEKVLRAETHAATESQRARFQRHAEVAKAKGDDDLAAEWLIASRSFDIMSITVKDVVAARDKRRLIRAAAAAATAVHATETATVPMTD